MPATDGDCACEFDPYDPADYEPGEEIEESWHYRRVCDLCGEVWWATHCPHDGTQNPCPECGWIAPGKRTPGQILGPQGGDLASAVADVCRRMRGLWRVRGWRVGARAPTDTHHSIQSSRPSTGRSGLKDRGGQVELTASVTPVPDPRYALGRCPACSGWGLQVLPQTPCMYGDPCTHGCSDCGWHFVEERQDA